jgi:hypothetical protein
MRTPDLTPEAARELAAMDDALAGFPVEPDLTELGELALALREQRPEVSPEFAASLDARDWGARERRSRLKMPSWFGFAPAFAASLFLALVVSVAILGGNGDENPVDAGSEAVGVSEPSGGSAGGGESASAGDESAARAKQGPSGSLAAPTVTDTARDGRRKVERSASLELAAPPREIDAVAAGILRVTDDLGGFVRSSSVSSTTDGGGGTFELRIPTARLNRALAELSRLARVRSRTQSSQDITSAFVSARDRIEDAQAERRALLRALGRAVTVNETASIRARLRIVNEEIASAKAELQRAQNRANYSTVVVNLVGDPDLDSSDPNAEDDGSWTPGDALKDAGRILEVAAGVALIALAIGLPIALIALLTAVAARQVTRRRRERALDAV